MIILLLAAAEMALSRYGATGSGSRARAAAAHNANSTPSINKHAVTREKTRPSLQSSKKKVKVKKKITENK
jgi:hypothetical protein